MGDDASDKGDYAIPDDLERLDKSGYEPGTNVLITDSDGSRGRPLALRALAEGEPEEGRILVTASPSPEEVIAMFREFVPDEYLSNLHVIDASGLRGSATSDSESQPVFSTVTTISDIGISITESERSLDADRLRMAFLSVHPLLDVVEPDKAFSFLYLLTSRIEQSDYIGVYSMATNPVSRATIGTFEPVFDGVAEIRSSNPDEYTVDLRGFSE